MKVSSCVILSAALLSACSSKESAPKVEADTPQPASASPTPAPTDAPVPVAEPPPKKELAVAESLPCETVYTHLAETYPDAYPPSAESKLSTLAKCEREWAASFRECMSKSVKKYDRMTCESEGRATECEQAFERLGALATMDEKNDASLASKKKAFLSACNDVKAAPRKCLLESTTLASYRDCDGIAPVAAIAATPELGWEIDGLSSWTWPEQFKTPTAVRVASLVVQADDTIVRPALSIHCGENKLGVSISTQLHLDDGGAKITKISPTIRLDGGEAFNQDATILFTEHVTFSDSDDFAKKLVSHKSLEVEIKGPSGAPISFKFGIGGTKEVLSRLGDCSEVAAPAAN